MGQTNQNFSFGGIAQFKPAGDWVNSSDAPVNLGTSTPNCQARAYKNQALGCWVQALNCMGQDLQGPTLIGVKSLVAEVITLDCRGQTLSSKAKLPLVAGVKLPLVAGVKPLVAGVKPLIAGVKPLVAGVKPLVAGVKPLVAGVKPLVAGVKPLVAKVKPLVAGVKS